MSMEICAEFFVSSKGPEILLVEWFANHALHDVHAIAEVATPAVAPAAPKQARVPKLG